MKPIKNFESIAKWIMRIAIVAFIIFTFKDGLSHFDFKKLEHILAAVYMIFAALLLFGVFSKGGGLTVVSGLIISIVSAFQIYFCLQKFGGISLNALMYAPVYLYLMILGIGLFFASKGNS